MSYQQFVERMLPLYIIYLALIIVCAVSAIYMYFKWKDRRVPPPIYLTIAYILLTAIFTVLFLGLSEALITGYCKEIYKFSLPFAYSTVLYFNLCFLKFANYIMKKGEKLFYPFLAFSIVITIALYLPWNWWGVPTPEIGTPDIRLYTTMSAVIISYIVYFYIAIMCVKLKKQTTDKVATYGLTLLFYTMITYILFFFFMIMDTIMVVLFDHPGYSEFTYIAWAFLGVGVVTSYLSLVMPGWLIKWISKKENSS